jgi:four helix bundle protein
MTVTCFEDLDIWKVARELCKIVRLFTIREPFNHDCQFKNQINSATGSIMDNIAKGFDRDGKKEFLQFLSTRKGSCGETISQSYLAFDAGYITQEELNDLLVRTQRLKLKIGNFMNSLKNSPLTGTKYK